MPLSPRPAGAGSPVLGALAFTAADAGACTRPMPAVPDRWDLDTSGAALPTGPAHLGLAPHGGRVAHQHAWFAELALAHAGGQPGAASRALAGISAWLRHDLPGQGPAWEHPSDAALRLLRWHAALGWLGDAAPSEMRAALAGSAEWHLRALRAQLPLERAAVHRRLAHQCGRVVGGLTFPGAPGAREAWSEGMSGLEGDLGGLVGGDGSPVDGDLPRALRSAWLCAITLAVARANGVSAPSPAVRAWARLVHFLATLSGGVGWLPPGREPVEVELLPAVPYPLAASLRNLAAAWGALDPTEAPADDPRCRWLNVRPPAGVGAPTPSKAVWRMHSFAEDGWVVCECAIRGLGARVLVSAASGSRRRGAEPFLVRVDLGASGCLRGAPPVGPWVTPPGRAGTLARVLAPSSRLEVARVDGKKARIEGEISPGGARRVAGDVGWRRAVLLNQQRVIVTDTRAGSGALELVWELDPAWTVDGQVPALTLRCGELTATLQLPAALAWEIGDGRLVGRGSPACDEAMVTTLEIR